MARKSDSLPDGLGTDDSDSWLGGIVADEDDLDRHTLWRLGLWGFAAAGAVSLGILSGQLPVTVQRTQLATDEFAGRAKQVEATVQQNQLEARRLAAAIETLNSDRDRLFKRMSSLKQGLDVITGSIKKADEKPATPWPDAAIPPIVAFVPATIALAPSATAAPPSVVAAPAVEPEPAPTLVAARTEPPQAEIASPSAIQAIPMPDTRPAVADANASAVEESPVAAADFGLDLGAAHSVNGLRALWRGLVKSHTTQLDGLRPLIAVRERRSGLGLQLRLIAGPIRDAAAAERLCALLGEAKRECKTTAFDGQRLSLAAEPEEKAPPRPQKPRKSTSAAQPETAPAATPSLATMLGFR